MQMQADWSATKNVISFEADFKQEFKGPGLYLTNEDTLLVTPLPPNEEATLENVWSIKQPNGTVYHVDVFNCNFRNTIFAAIAVAPTRLDNRS